MIIVIYREANGTYGEIDHANQEQVSGGFAVLTTLLLVGVAVACDGPPQTPGATPSGCAATLAGEVVGGQLASGIRTSTVALPTDAEVHVTGTVTNHSSGLFAFPLPWELKPLGISDTVPKNSSTTVDETWTNSGDARDVTLEFVDTLGFAADYEWDLHLSSSGNGCPPATAEACANAGGNIFYADPTEIDGEQREGCYKDDSSCIADIPTRLSETECDPDDILTKSLAANAGAGAIVYYGGRLFAVIGAIVESPVAGAALTGALVIAAGILIGVAGYQLYLVIATDDPQTIATVQADPGVIDDVMDRMPTMAEDNPGYTGDALKWAAKLTIAECVSDLVLDHVISRLGAYGDLVDPITGLVHVGGLTRHLCELIPTYRRGGATAGPTGAPMVSASLHIRDVLYNEENGVDTQTGNPSPPQIQWQFLERAAQPAGDPVRRWYANAPYNCQGTYPSTACDEWPWYRTKQGGPGAHLRIIDYEENRNGGSDLIGFYDTCSVAVNDLFFVVPLSAKQIRAGNRSVRSCPGS